MDRRLDDSAAVAWRRQTSLLRHTGAPADPVASFVATVRAAADALDEAVGVRPPEPARSRAMRLASVRDDPLVLAALAWRYLRHRRRREALFPAGLFADPAWDLLLDLYVAAAEGRRICVSSACLAAAVPSTTALRWIALLEAKGLIVRIADTSDRRRAYVALSPDASAAVGAWLKELSEV